MPDIKITDPNVGKFVMPWADLTKPPSSADIDNYIEKQVKPKLLKTNPSAEAESLWTKANKPMFPDVTIPGTTKAGPTLEDAEFRQQHPYQSLAGDTVREFMQGAYDKLIQPMSSPVGMGVTAATSLAGVPGIDKVARPAARLGLGALAAKGATEVPEAYKQFKVNPNVDTGQNLALSVASPLAIGAGAVELGVPKVKGETAPVPKPEVRPEVQAQTTQVQVAIPKGVTVKLQPGYEDVLGEDPKTKQVIIKNVDGFKKGVGDIKGPDAAVKKLAADLKAAQPSVDYNQNYNPDAVVQSNINGPADPRTSFADWVNGRAAAKWTGQNIGKAFGALDEKYGIPKETWYHGTTNENLEAIRNTGKFDPNAGLVNHPEYGYHNPKRPYDYSSGPDTSFFTNRKDSWLDKKWASESRAASYDTNLKARPTDDAKIATVNNIDELNNLAKKAGFNNAQGLDKALSIDGLQSGASEEDLTRSRANVKQFIDRTGYHGINLNFDDPKIDWENDAIPFNEKQAKINPFGGRQLMMFDSSKMTPDFSDDSHPLIKLQKAIANGEEPEVERYMNQLHEEIRKAGSSGRQLDLGYKEDYLPQMWQNSPEEVADAFKSTKRLGIKPSFGMEAVFKDYEQGVKNGLTPKFDKPSDLMASYASYVDKFVADKNFFDQLKENGQLKTRAQIGSDWKNWEALDPKRTPVQRFVTSEPLKGEGETNITREYYVPKDLAANINDYLQGTDKDSTWGKIKQAGGQLKSLAMTSGIPGTGLNIHGINVGVGRMWQAGGAKMVGQYLKYALDPEAATNFTRSNLYEAPRFVKAGLQFSPSLEPKTLEAGASALDKVQTAKHNLLERPIFGQVIPALQLELAQMVEKGYLDRGIEQNLATKLAVHDANNFVSNLNYDEIMRDKTTRNLVSAISFAPQWLESHARIATGAAKALLNPKDPKGYLYRQATSQLVKAYLATGLINKATSGTFDPFELHLGKDKDSGKDLSIPLLGSGDDWLKIIPQIAQAAYEGKPFSKISDLTKGRLATPVQFGVDFLAKQKAQGGDLLRDRKGDLPVVVPDGKRNSQVENVAELGARTLAPRWIPSTIDFVRGQGSLGKVAADAAGFQTRERSVPKVKSAF